MDGVGRDPRIGLLPAHPEDHKGVGWDGGGGVEGFPQPTPRATLVHSDRHLQTTRRQETRSVKKEKLTNRRKCFQRDLWDICQIKTFLKQHN